MTLTAANKYQTFLIMTAFMVAIRVAPAWGAELAQRRDPFGRDRASRIRTLEFRDSDRSPVSTMPWQEARRAFSTPEDTCRAVKDRVTYSRNAYKKDERGSAKETWNRRQGDCEDYALTVKDLSSGKGWKANMYVVRSKTAREAHAITMGKRNGRIWVSSNGFYSEYQSLFDAKQEIGRDLGWWNPEVEMFRVQQPKGNGSRTYVKISVDTGK
ncbi:MAG: hypothetical protein R6V03_01430 [Kiritimatiellia bacterium]